MEARVKYKLMIVLLLVAPVLTQAEDSALSALKASEDSWEGVLYYLDYQSGQRFEIPMRIDAEMTPDGATLVRRLTFTDPGHLVYAVSLLTIERDSGDLAEAYFRDHKGELSRYTITTAEYGGETKWRVVYEQDGEDDDRPARIRHTMTRDGGLMTSSKEVRFLGEEGKFFLRNGTEVRLAGGE